MQVYIMGSGTSSSIPLFNCLAQSPITCTVCKLGLEIREQKAGKCVKFNKNKRRNSSCLVKIPLSDGSIKNIIIDVGKTFYESSLTWFIEYEVVKIDAVLLTHGHADAMLGMDDLRMWTAGNSSQLQPSVQIYLDKSTFDVVDKSFPYLTNTSNATGSGEVASLQFNLIEAGKPIELFGEIVVMPFEVQHGFNSDDTPYYALGFRIKEFTYLSDVSHIPDSAKPFINGTRLMIIDGLRPLPHKSHFGFSQSIDACNELMETPGNAYFTGLGHNMEHEEINKWIGQQIIKEGLMIECGYDGQACIIQNSHL
jgi:phosphoribosyl 1,2-cyclic phosphodiesterase